MIKDGKMKQATLALLVSASVVAPIAASAAVVVYTDDRSLQQNKQEKQYFSQSGLSGEAAPVIPGAGDHWPLKLVTKQIVPSNWRVESSGNFDAAAVSWTGGLAWSQILRDIAQREGIFITLDWVKKVATFNVPGERAQIATSNREELEKAAKAQSAFVQKQIEETSKRTSQAEVRSNHDREQLELLMARSKESQTASQKLIEQLNQSNQRAEVDKKTLKDMLEKEKKAKNDLLQKYAVITPASRTGMQGDVDATTLFAEHKKRWVLPFDPSFDYFIKGGYTDSITLETPATFIAKPGSIEHVVTQWCEQIGCILEYRSSILHQNKYEVEFKGSFYQASTELISIFKTSDRPLDIQFYPDVRLEKDGKIKKGLVVVSDLNFNKAR